ncbi:ABC transporter ATP-binding protein [Micromonospora rubida]|uniref:ABC transporter ATP-binding protein n=1 Tax=Micromonospora rubida TaxID=2697657 RepID=UPI001376A99C|nr:ABC transporter ATP-binding protein [Micromonospora rubida]NBE83254.1 ATP-binding cassette domain-containing protein [Micromonospora rubida]
MRKIALAAGFLLRLGYRTDRRRLFTAIALMTVGYLATPLIGVVLAAFTNAAIGRDGTVVVLLALAAALLLVFELTMMHFAHLSYFELGDLEQLALTDEVAAIVNGSAGIDHFDDPRFVEALTLVNENLIRVRNALESTLQLGGVVLQIGLTAVLLVSVDPWLVMLPLAALPPVLLSNRAQRVVDDAQEAAAVDIQVSRHLVKVATTGSSAKEIRLAGAREAVISRQRAAWAATTGRLRRAHLHSALLRAGGQVLFAAAYGTAIFLVVRGAVRGEANIGQVVLVLTLAVQVSVQVAGLLGMLGTLQQMGRTVARIDLLRQLTAGPGAPAIGPVRPAAASPPTSAQAWGPAGGKAVSRTPARLRRGIRLEQVSFAYPGADEPVVRDVSMEIPAGSTLALVGENGAGKSTLVRMICGLCQPTSGRITVDGIDLRELTPDQWRSRVATLFQDFARFELLLRENVGLGRPAAVDADQEIMAALDRAGARGIVRRVPGGLDGLLGHSYGDGMELSGGQWQTLGLARTLMRRDPLLVALDEPAAALDALAEHALFERLVNTAAGVRGERGVITVFVSHRFSTVRAADQIAVLRGGRLWELGSHDALMSANGLYADLFTVQANAYR